MMERDLFQIRFHTRICFSSKSFRIVILSYLRFFLAPITISRLIEITRNINQTIRQLCEGA